MITNELPYPCKKAMPLLLLLIARTPYLFYGSLER
jgi:hypothetical protein